MSLRSDALVAAFAAATLCSCGATARPAGEHVSGARPPSATHRAGTEPATEAEDRTALLTAAYRFELALHASDADRREFSGFFLDYPPEQEAAFLAAFAWQSPPVRARRYCRVTPEKAIVDAMTGSPAISFVAQIKAISGARAVVTMTWYTDPESGAGTMLGLERGLDGWVVRGCEVLWAH